MKVKQDLVIISGASRGIGAAIAKRYVDAGAHVIICSRDIVKLNALQAELESSPGKLSHFVADMSKEKDVLAFAEFCIHTSNNQIDVLINNAGVFTPGNFAELAIADFQAMMQINFWGTAILVKALWPVLIQNPVFVANISSIAAQQVYSGGAAYGITKAALTLYSLALRKELQATGGRVTTVYPGATLTDSWNGTDLPDSRFMPPSDIAEIIYQCHQLSNRTVVEEIILRPLLGDI